MHSRQRAFLGRMAGMAHREETPEDGAGGRGHGGEGRFASGRFGPRFGPGQGPGGGFGSGPGGPRGPRGGRARRGNVRAAVLALLAERPQHGYQIITELENRSGGRWKPSPGSVYPVLAQLSDEGLVRPEEVDGRRVFHLTEAGTTAAEQVTAGPPPWETGASADGIDLREAVGGLAGAAREVARGGNEAQAAQARAVIDEARRAIYRILADAPVEEPGA